MSARPGSGAGTLSDALAQLNASDPALGPDRIELRTDVALSGPLSPIFGWVTIGG